MHHELSGIHIYIERIVHTVLALIAQKLSPCVNWEIASGDVARHLAIDSQPTMCYLLQSITVTWQSVNILNYRKLIFMRSLCTGVHACLFTFLCSDVWRNVNHVSESCDSEDECHVCLLISIFINIKTNG